MSKKLAVHICCGPCAVYPIDEWAKEGYDVTGFWYNPNIHPYIEYSKRLESLKRFAGLKELGIAYDESYDLDCFLKKVASSPSEPERCYHCYQMRLSRTAEFAREEGYDLFTTTLSVSPFQKHDLLKEIGNKVADQNGIRFLYQDFRSGYREGRLQAREMGLYLQKYCGCIYSERDRFITIKTKVSLGEHG
ncbi:MAG: hypothetical protein CO189_02145 [candidate division Zixibacteria bacterium CG_4_9_14_3_um_filter_46_8]|nr:MAG: hypothetical protein CO189_02145 [candidate division Zixibacteria bacterium CG_4_9_14_3_um_filter_46_8]